MSKSIGKRVVSFERVTVFSVVYQNSKLIEINSIKQKLTQNADTQIPKEIILFKICSIIYLMNERKLNFVPALNSIISQHFHYPVFFLFSLFALGILAAYPLNILVTNYKIMNF